MSQLFVCGLALHAIAASGLLRLEWSTALAERFLPDDPAIAATDEARSLFGPADAVVVLAEWSAPVESAELAAALGRWREQLSSIAGVEGVRSLLDAPVAISAPGADRKTGYRLVTLGTLDRPVARAPAHPLARKLFLRSDGRGTLLLVHPAPEYRADPLARRALVERLQQWAADTAPPFRITLTGIAPVQAAGMDAAERDLLRIAPVLGVVVLGGLALALGSGWAAFAIVVVAAMNIAATFGTAGWLQIRPSPFNSIVSVIIFTVALLDNIHIAHGFARRARRDDTVGDLDAERREEEMSAARAELFAPCAWTTATTVVGFAVLMTGALPQLRQFGALAALGTVWAFASSFLLLPRVLVRMRLRPSAGFDRWTPATGTRRPRLVLAAAAIVVLVASVGVPNVRLSSDFPRLFADTHPVTRELERIEQDWGGLATATFLLTPRDADWRSAEGIDRLVNFLLLLEQRALVSAVVSPLDLVRDAERAARESGGGPLDTDALRSSVFDGRAGNGGAEVLADLIGKDGRTARVVARVHMMQPERFPELAADLIGLAAGLEEFFDVRLGGWPLVFYRLDDLLLSELRSSFVLAFAAVSSLMFFALRSPRWWLLSLLPNLAPLWIVLGVFGWSGAAFTPGLLLAPGMALGLVVDDTIHFMWALRRESARTDGRREAVERALADVGRALTLTSTVLVFGLALLCLSEFTGNRQLGAVLAATAVLAWVADLVVVPAAFIVGRHGETRS